MALGNGRSRESTVFRIWSLWIWSFGYGLFRYGLFGYDCFGCGLLGADFCITLVLLFAIISMVLPLNSDAQQRTIQNILINASDGS